MSTHAYGYVTPDGGEQERLKKVKDIIDRGKIAVCTAGTLVKKIKEWNLDSDGDLTAFQSNGLVSYVCLATDKYIITEEDPHE